MVGQLSWRTSGQLVERAWASVEIIYGFHTELYDLSVKAHVAAALCTIRAWKAREKMLRETTNSPPETPGYIRRLQSLLPLDESKSTRVDESPGLNSHNVGLPGNTQPPVDVTWDQMLGIGVIDWGDMFAVPSGGQTQGGHGGFGTAFGGDWM